MYNSKSGRQENIFALGERAIIMMENIINQGLKNELCEGISLLILSYSQWNWRLHILCPPKEIKNFTQIDIWQKRSQFGWSGSGTGCPGKWSHHPCGGSRGARLWRWVLWFRGYRGRAGLMVGLGDVKGFSSLAHSLAPRFRAGRTAGGAHGPAASWDS